MVMFHRGDKVVFTKGDRWEGIDYPAGTEGVFAQEDTDSESGKYPGDPDGDAVVVLVGGEKPMKAWIGRLALKHPPAKPTEQVPVESWDAFREGDTVVGFRPGGYPIVEREKTTVPEAGTFGSALVGGLRYRGFIARLGNFTYPNSEGVRSTRSPGAYTDFQPEG